MSDLALQVFENRRIGRAFQLILEALELASNFINKLS